MRKFNQLCHLAFFQGSRIHSMLREAIETAATYKMTPSMNSSGLWGHGISVYYNARWYH